MVVRAKENVIRNVNKLCTSCGNCELVCSLYHFGRTTNCMARIRAEMDRRDFGTHVTVCHHCDEPACMEACPEEGAMYRSKKTNAVVVDMDKCTKCLECADACPYSALPVGPAGEPLKCDLCDGDPKCVKLCLPRPANNFRNYPETPQSCLRI